MILQQTSYEVWGAAISIWGPVVGTLALLISFGAVVWKVKEWKEQNQSDHEELKDGHVLSHMTSVHQGIALKRICDELDVNTEDLHLNGGQLQDCPIWEDERAEEVLGSDYKDEAIET